MSSLLADISLKALVAERVEWGHDLNFFLNAFESCVTGLTPANPFVTTNALIDAMRQAVNIL